MCVDRVNRARSPVSRRLAARAAPNLDELYVLGPDGVQRGARLKRVRTVQLSRNVAVAPASGC